MDYQQTDDRIALAQLKLIRSNKDFDFEHVFKLALEDEGLMEVNIDKNGARFFVRITGDVLSVEEMKKMQDLIQIAIDYQESL